MNEAQRAAFELRFDDLKNLGGDPDTLVGTLLAACSAHDPDPKLQVRVIRHLLASGVPVNETDKNGVTPLHRAVRFLSPAAAKELLARGADVNAIDRRTRSTPLHRAVTNTGAPTTAGKQDAVLTLVKLLLASGADPCITNKQGRSPVDYAKDRQLDDLLSQYSAH